MPPQRRAGGSASGAGASSDVGEPVEEDEGSLRAAAANQGNLAHGAPNVLRIPTFQLPLCDAAARTLSPPLPPHRRARF
jgi:hypothetical protein